MGEHWSAEEAASLDPRQELDSIEIGDRADWHALLADMAGIYSSREDRESAAVVMLVGQVAEATTHRGLPFPDHWRPVPSGEGGD